MDIPHAFVALGLHVQATLAEAKAAYRSLAMHWHPDVNTSPDAEARMKTINVAYGLVTAQLARREQAASGARPPPAAPRPAADTAGTGTANGFSEFDWRAGFTATAGAGQRQDTPVQRTVSVSLFEAAFGCVKRVKGSASDGWTLYVRIHPGSCDGAEIAQADIRIYASVQAVPRAFKLSVQIEKHPLFLLDQNRLSVSVPMSIWRWTLGGDFTVPTLEGTARVILPPRASVVVFKNQGWPHFRQAHLRYPLYVSPRRIYPASLSDEDQRLLQALDAGARLPEIAGWRHSMQAWAESYAAQGQGHW